MLNPIVPHFAQNAWKKFVYPVMSKCAGLNVSEDLMDVKWPVASSSYDKNLQRMYIFLKKLKSEIRLSFEKAKTGGKKKPKKGQPPAEVKELKNMTYFVADKYPEWQRTCIEILLEHEYNEQNQIQGKYIEVLNERIDKAKLKDAMKFAGFLVKEIIVLGKDAVLEIEVPFD